MAARTSSILRARDRVRAVLVPFLGAQLAAERANNIAQVLIFNAEHPAWVALGMLEGLGLPDPVMVAGQVGLAWEDAVQEAVA